MLTIRPHRRADADAIGDILAKGWAQAYSRFMPEELLAPRIDPLRRGTEIAEWLDGDFNPSVEAIYVAEDRIVCGFVHVELGDKAELGAVGLINLLYVDPAAQGRGLGRRLMGAAARWLVNKAAGPLALSTYTLNPYRGFYDALGGDPVKELSTQFGAHELRSVLYVWREPATLIGPDPP